MSVYILRAGVTGPVKIGFTMAMNLRVRAIQNVNSQDVQVIRVLEGDRGAERWMHERFAHVRRHGEWFDFDPEMLSAIPPETDWMPTTERSYRRAGDAILSELHDLMNEVAQPIRLGEKISVTLERIAQRMGMRPRRVRAIWNREAQVISYSEMEAFRSAVEILRAEHALLVELKDSSETAEADQ